MARTEIRDLEVEVAKEEQEKVAGGSLTNPTTSFPWELHPTCFAFDFHLVQHIPTGYPVQLDLGQDPLKNGTPFRIR